MNYKTLLIGIVITIFSGVLFCLPAGSIALIIPSLLFAGVLGGLYVGYKRKRPIANCAYDSFLVIFPTSIILGFLLIPLFWYYHDLQNQNIVFLTFLFLLVSGTILLTGIAGGIFGGLFIGLYYHYVKKDRGELDLYETYLVEKTSDKKKDNFTK